MNTKNLSLLSKFESVYAQENWDELLNLLDPKLFRRLESEDDGDLSDEKLDILRLSIQFLCNLFTFAYKDSNFPDQYNIPQYLYDTNVKDAIMNAMHSECTLLVRASCVFIHNALKEFEGETFIDTEKSRLCIQLLKPIKDGFTSAMESLMLLLYHTNVLQTAYNNMTLEDKLCLLEIIYKRLSNSVEDPKEGYMFTMNTIEFLIEKFCRRSDLILKTVDACLDEIEPTEVVILLDILGTLTSGSCKEYNFIKDHKSLLINCIYLLKSIQMIGKQSDNCFTPLQKLSDVASAMPQTTGSPFEENPNGNSETEKAKGKITSAKNDIHSHPAFGFKAGLIRVIGNMSYRNKECQDIIRETDAIPLLLDCCNIDARNPLIMQWTILALRNLCEDNPANQEIIRNCTRVGVVASGTLREMGVTLHEDEQGTKIGIVPLSRERM
ncbi:ataxin-10 [Xylocopa sonorina]|uniref:ataxin-10 n=1 Tax=Xylocopa sonorina TaxID=1818115 RepID=UPI00403A9621